eukprot:902337-Pyramimonas_sp.AAC.1
MAAAYVGNMSPAISAKIEAMLLESMASDQHAVRLSAVQWAARLFPFSHPPARYVCVLGAGDVKFDVKVISPPPDPLQTPNGPLAVPQCTPVPRAGLGL